MTRSGIFCCIGWMGVVLFLSMGSTNVSAQEFEECAPRLQTQVLLSTAPDCMALEGARGEDYIQPSPAADKPVLHIVEARNRCSEPIIFSQPENHNDQTWECWLENHSCPKEGQVPAGATATLIFSSGGLLLWSNAYMDGRIVTDTTYMEDEVCGQEIAGCTTASSYTPTRGLPVAVLVLLSLAGLIRLQGRRSRQRYSQTSRVRKRIVSRRI